MAQLINLGKIRFTYEGEYNALTEYSTNQVVKYGANVYAYTSSTASTGNLPTNTAYWTLMLEGIDFKGEYDDSATYQLGDLITYGGKAYIATSVPSVGFAPGDPAPSGETNPWSQLVDGIQYEGEWSTLEDYQTGDVVKYGGVTYIALKDSSGTAPGNAEYWDTFVEGVDYRGVYDSLEEYNLNDIVTYDGSSWICLQNTTGNTPADPSSFWDILAPGTYPSFVGNEGAFLSNNGTNVIWTADVAVDTLEAIENLYVGENARTQWENSGAKTYTVTNKSKTDDIVTLTTSTNHTLGAFQFIEVALDPADPDFDGEYEIIDVTSNTLTYEKVGDDVTSTGTGGTVDAVTGYTNSVAHFYIDADDYAQVSFRNASNAVNASTDFIAYASNGDDFAGYIDMGITSENFSDPEFTITGANDGYIFMDAPVGTSGAGNLVLATGARGTENKIVFAAGGLDSDSTQMEITPDVNVHIEIPTPSISPSTGALTVVGGVGVQGDMNIQGNVNIVGEISFGGEGTVVETSNLAVSDPTVFVGSNNLSDVLDLGIIAEYAEDVVDQVTAVTNKQLTDNVATLTTSAAHGYSVGDVVIVTGVDSTFNGTFVITATPASDTFRYSKTAGNVSSTAVSPEGVATVTHERRYGGVVRDATDGIVKVFSGSTERPTGTVDFANAGLSYTGLKAGDADFTSLTTGNITSTSGTINLGGTVNISSAANFTGASVTLGSGTWSGTPTFSGNVIFSGNPSFTGTPTFTGGVRVQEMIEDVVDVNHTSNAMTLDYQNGNIFYLTNTLGGNATVNIINAPTDNDRVFTVNILITQGSTGYIPSTLNINGSSTTIKWSGGSAPTPTSSSGKIDIFNFTIIRKSSTFIVLGNANTNF